MRKAGWLLCAAAILSCGLANIPSKSSGATLIVVQEDGDVSVRVDGRAPVAIPQACVEPLERQLSGQVDASQVEQAVEDIVRSWAAADPELAAAIVAYALALVSPDLAGAVIAGAQRGNPEASNELEIAAGARPPPPGSILTGAPVGGGGGTAELRRGASPIN